MSEVAPIAISADGGTIARGDGPELLVYDGTGTPQWKQFLDDVVVGVGVAPDRTVALLSTGRVVGWRAHLTAIDPVDIPGATRIAVSTEGVLAVAAPDGIHVIESGSAVTLPFKDARCLCFGPDRGTLGVATPTPPTPMAPKVGNGGKVAPPPPPPPPGSWGFHAIDARSGVAWGGLALPGPIAAVAWVGAGMWAIAHGNAVSLVSPDGSTLLKTWTEPGPVTAAAGAPDGVAVAAVVDGSTIVVWEVVGFKCAGRITVSRPVIDLAFAPKNRLVVGLDDADLTFVDLFTGQITRSEPHPGRGRNNWGVKAELEPGVIRGAAVRKGAGKVAIARYVGAIDDPAYERRRWQSCLLSFGLFLFLLLVCAGCLGGVWIAYLMKLIPGFG